MWAVLSAVCSIAAIATMLTDGNAFLIILNLFCAGLCLHNLYKSKELSKSSEDDEDDEE